MKKILAVMLSVAALVSASSELWHQHIQMFLRMLGIQVM